MSGTQRAPGPRRDSRPLPRWRLAVYYADGRERLIDATAECASDAIVSAMDECGEPGFEVDRVVVVLNPLRKDLKGKRHDVVVGVPAAAVLAEERLRKNGKLIDGPVQVSYRVGVEYAEIVFSQWR